MVSCCPRFESGENSPTKWPAEWVVPKKIGGMGLPYISIWFQDFQLTFPNISVGNIWNDLEDDFKLGDRNCNFANFLPGSLLSRFPMFLFWKIVFCFDSSQRVGFRPATQKTTGTPPKTNMSPKRDYFSREYIFQPLIFNWHVSFQGTPGVGPVPKTSI